MLALKANESSLERLIHLRSVFSLFLRKQAENGAQVK